MMSKTAEYKKEVKEARSGRLDSWSHAATEARGNRTRKGTDIYIYIYCLTVWLALVESPTGYIW